MREPQVQEGAGRSAAARHIGAIKTIAGNVITLTPDSGPEIDITVQAAARLVRIAPGEKNLKNATPIQLQDLQVGDRILVAGKTSDNTKVITVTSVVVMKRSDVEAHKEEDRQDWQTRGLGGLVRAVDPAAGTVTISVTGFGGAKTFVVHASKDTGIRRYAPDSMRFDAARPSTLQEIQPGDQLRARGNRSADGTELTAEEILSGSFRNVAGTVNSVDASAGTMKRSGPVEHEGSAGESHAGIATSPIAA
jgi:Copper binding periplasmic protein CusF